MEVTVNRKEYGKLMVFLRSNSVPYGWITPEGPTFAYQSQRYFITSTMKADHFLRKIKDKTKEDEEKDNHTDKSEIESDLGENLIDLQDRECQPEDDLMEAAAPPLTRRAARDKTNNQKDDKINLKKQKQNTVCLKESGRFVP